MNVEQIRRSLAQKAEISYEAYEQAKADLPHDEFYANYAMEFTSTYADQPYKYYRLVYPEASEVSVSLLFEMLNSQKRQEEKINFIAMVVKIFFIIWLVIEGLAFLQILAALLA